MTVFYEKGVNEGVRNLSEDESKHCFQVLRHKIGDKILVFDGLGGIYNAVLTQVSKKSCEFELTESKIEPAKTFKVHLGISPTKNSERMEWMVEKLAEIGVDEVTLIKTAHSERRKARLDRLEKKAISAMKQSGNPFKLQINEMVSFQEFAINDTSQQKVIANVDPSHPHLKDQINPNLTTTILVGPEGDFSNEELNLAITKGYTPVSLGKPTLRTETAGLIACSIINVVNGF